MTRKQPKPDYQINVTSVVTHDHYRVKNWVANQWAPIIGPYAFMLYNIYCSAANKDRGNAWFFSLNTLAEYTYWDRSTINMNNWLLEICGLIRVTQGKDGYANEYIILDPPHVTVEQLKKVMAVLEEPAEVGQKWRIFKQNTIERIRKWRSLAECGKTSQHKKGVIETQKKAGQQELFTNKPEVKPVAKSSEEEELIACLVAEFANNKPKLSASAAKKMIEQYGAKAVEQQLAWLAEREIQENPLKTLRAALKGDWSEPQEEPIPEPWYAGMEDIILH